MIILYIYVWKFDNLHIRTEMFYGEAKIKFHSLNWKQVHLKCSKGLNCRNSEISCCTLLIHTDRCLRNLYILLALRQHCIRIYLYYITVNDLFSASALVTAPYLFFPMTVHNIHIFFYILYVFLLNKLTFLSRLSSLFSSTAIFTGSGYF